MFFRLRKTMKTLALLLCLTATAAAQTLVGWNNLGMHCMDDDYSVFSILPPYNTVDCQLIDAQGRLVTDPTGIIVTYRGRRRSGWLDQHELHRQDELLGIFAGALQRAASAGHGLPFPAGNPGRNMPGPANEPQVMGYDGADALVRGGRHPDHSGG